MTKPAPRSWTLAEFISTVVPEIVTRDNARVISVLDASVKVSKEGVTVLTVQGTDESGAPAFASFRLVDVKVSE